MVHVAFATSVDEARRSWAQASWIQRLLVLPYALVGLSAVLPWVRGRPFMDGFMGSPEQGFVTSYGYEVGGPLFLVALAGLAAIVLVAGPRSREFQVAAWLLLALPALLASGWVDYVCFLCGERELLWGWRFFQAATVAGLVLASIDLVRGSRSAPDTS